MVNNNPPLYPTSMSVDDIIGWDSLEMFKAFCQIYFAHSVGGDFPDKEINRDFSVDARKTVAGIFEKLRDHGIYIVGLDQSGKIMTRNIMKSDSHQLFDEDIERFEAMTKEELSAAARSGYVNLKNQPNTDINYTDRQFEKVLG